MHGALDAADVQKHGREDSGGGIVVAKNAMRCLRAAGELTKAEWRKCEAQNDQRQNGQLANLHDYPQRGFGPRSKRVLAQEGI